MAAHDPVTDGNTAQWDKLKAARGERGEPSHTPVEVKGIEKTTVVVGRDPETGKFAATQAPAETPPVETPAAEAPVETQPVEPPPPATPTAPSGEEIEIEPGVKVTLDPALAAAFKKAGEIKAQQATTSDRETLKAELREELKKELAPATPAKSEAELAAEAALRAAEDAERNLPPEPSVQDMIADPAKYDEMRKARDKAEKALLAERVRAETKREVLGEIQKQNQTAAQDADVRARGILREQFYAAYPVLRDSADLVDPILNDQFNTIMASGKLTKPMTPAEGEALKATEFADVATKATRRLVKLRGVAQKVAPPPPSNLVSSAPAKAPAPKKPEPEKPREKYPQGSVSRLLRQHQDGKSGASV